MIPEPFGQLVHLGFVRDGGLGDAEAPHGAGKDVVGVDAVRVHADIGDIIRTAQVEAAFLDYEGAQAGIGALVAPDISLHGA